MVESMARVQGEGKRLGRTRDDIPDGYISWDEHHEAWAIYSRRWDGVTSEDIEARGGFGYRELIALLGRPPKTWVPRDAERFKDFAFRDSERPGYEKVVAEDVVKKSHIYYVGSEMSICKGPSEVPEGPIFFDDSPAEHCGKCVGKFIEWIDWWTRKKGSQ